jgi:putative redox protein
MGVQIDIVYHGDFTCTAEHTPSTNTFTTDLPVDNGGKGTTFSPTDLVATALGTCMITIMGKVAEQEGIDLKDTKVVVIKEMVQTPVRRIGALLTKITIPNGHTLSDKQKAKLQNAAELCPVKKSLHPDVNLEITFDFGD